jgi:Ni/Co efflux regulator RcnB
MSKKWINLALAAAISVAPAAALADRDHGIGNGRGHDKGKEYKQEWKAEKHEAKREAKVERRYYREHDRELHEWYREHYNSLPPGLAKRDRLPPGLERQLVVRGTLPPGLQKKMQPCPVEVERFLPPPPAGYVHTVIGGNVVLVNRKTFFVLDVFHFEL